MAGPGLIYFNPALYGREDELILKWSITAAKTVSPLPINNSAVYAFQDAISSQSTINNFLGSTTEFTTTQFDSTAMGTDAFGCLINMSGESANVSGTISSTTTRAQASSVLALQISMYSGSNGATVVSEGVVAVSTLTDSSLSTQIACGSAGNIAFRAILSGYDALTSGLIVAKIHWVSI